MSFFRAAFFGFLFAVTLSFLNLLALPAHAAWNVQVADVGGSTNANVGNGSDLAIDSAGSFHVSYHDDGSTTGNGLKYATNASGNWVTTAVDGTGLGNYSSIAVDASGVVHIAYLGAISSMKYATNASGSFVTTTLDSTASGLYVSLALDSAGQVHIAYSYDTLYYATNAGGSWSVGNLVDVGSGGTATPYLSYNSIAIDSGDNVHIAYYAGGTASDLKYATNSSGSFVTSSVDTSGSVGTYPSIGIDSLGNVHVSYCSSSYLKYAENTSGTWTTGNVVSSSSSGTSSGCFSSLALDSANSPHITYYNPASSSLLYASSPVTTTTVDSSGISHTSTSWTNATVDNNATVGGYVYDGGSLAIDKSNQLAVSYSDGGRGDLKIATTQQLWSREVIEDTGNSGSHTSISPDGSYISHQYATSADLKQSRRASTTDNSWTSQTVATSGSIGQYTSTTNVFGLSTSGTTDDYRYISYYNLSNRDLYVAQINPYTLAVSSTAVDTGGDVGKYTSVVVDDSGYLHVSYYDDTNDDLKYATNASGAWVASTIDSGGSVGSHTSIDVDSAGYAYIAYYDYTNRDLKYATNASGTWVTSTVDTTGSSGLYTDIVAEDDGTVHISYARNMALGYAVYSGGWTKTTVDTTARSGYYTSMAVDDSGFVHIAYHDYTGGDLEYATNESSAWVKTTLDAGIDGSNVGKYASMAIDDNGLIKISYYDDTNDDLRLAVEPQ